jgi:hypothetical protein
MKDAIRPGLFPGPDNAPDTINEWDGLDELREEHEAALEQYASALNQLFRGQDAQLNARERREREAAVRREVEGTITRIVWAARDLIEEWRAVEDETAERTAEIEQLRARLAVLETEDLMRKRLAVWLDRLDPERVTAGVHTWSDLAAVPVPPERPPGPITRTFHPQQ